jgi:hypothetical protein
MRATPVPVMPGVSNLFTLLELIRDPARFQAELEKLEALRAEANAAIGRAIDQQALEAREAEVESREADLAARELAFEARMRKVTEIVE